MRGPRVVRICPGLALEVYVDIVVWERRALGAQNCTCHKRVAEWVVVCKKSIDLVITVLHEGNVDVVDKAQREVAWPKAHAVRIVGVDDRVHANI